MSEIKISNELNGAKNELISWHNDLKSLEKDKLYSIKHAQWIKEKQIKNRFIRGNNKQEEVQRNRKEVFWCSVGMNVGSELSEDHFAVVIKEYPKVAVVVPLSSVKENNNKSEALGFYEIGQINGLPENARHNFAVISQMKTMSKKRLANYKDKQKNFLKITLSDAQMDIIDQAILSNLTKIKADELATVAILKD